MIKSGFVMLVMLFALSACGGGATEQAVDPTAAVSLSRFTVTGTGPAENGVVPIDAAVNNGKLSFEWATSSSNDYHVGVYLSKDEILDTNVDAYILGRNCGDTYEFISGCGKQMKVDCVWSSDNKMACSTELKPKILTYWLDALPQDAWALAQVCNSLFTKCRVYSVPVQLR